MRSAFLTKIAFQPGSAAHPEPRAGRSLDPGRFSSFAGFCRIIDYSYRLQPEQFHDGISQY
jgi:hypothetical protein